MEIRREIRSFSNEPRRGTQNNAGHILQSCLRTLKKNPTRLLPPRRFIFVHNSIKK